MRKLGDIIQDLEDLTEELVMDHDLQMGDILALVLNYIRVHYPGAIEEYEDGTNPVYLYMHRDTIKDIGRKLK